MWLSIVIPGNVEGRPSAYIWRLATGPRPQIHIQVDYAHATTISENTQQYWKSPNLHRLYETTMTVQIVSMAKLAVYAPPTVMTRRMAQIGHGKATIRAVFATAATPGTLVLGEQ